MAGLLAGIVVGAFVFAATLFSGAQAYRQKGQLRWAHLTSLLLTIAAMATLSLLWPVMAAVVGGALILAALAAMAFESGWNRVLPVFHILFGAALVAGLPFGG